MSQKSRVITPNTTPQPRPSQQPQQRGRGGPRPVDIRYTKEYKYAARRWTSAIVAMPIFMYTTYVLYDRTYGGKRTKTVCSGERGETR